MSKSTLISIVPFPIAEFKPGIYPGFFEISASKNELPEVLVIGESIYHVEIDENRTITVKCPSEDIARSVVDDYITSNLAYSADDNAAPGLFWKPGEWNLSKILDGLKNELQEVKARQRRWFIKLVQLADDDWEKTQQHKFISDMQRHACKSLGLERPWIIIPKTTEGLTKCVACQSIISVDAVICPNCRCILNKSKYESMKFVEVK